MPSDAPPDVIVNGFGITLGDSVIGLQALRVAQSRGAIGARPVLFRRPGVRPMVEAFYGLAADFADALPFPSGMAPERGPMPALDGRFGRVIDIRDFAFDPGFRGVAMIDYFLRALGVDPDGVPPADKRNAWLAPRVAPQRPDFGGGYVLLCPFASMPQREMPAPVHAAAAAWLSAHVAVPVVTQPMDCTTPQQLCGLVAHAALVVSTDTAMVHLADALDVPCLAVFTTHRPEWRARDYPRCIAVHRPADLPNALEFARSEADVQAARTAWFDADGGLAWMDDALHRAVRMAGLI